LPVNERRYIYPDISGYVGRGITISEYIDNLNSGIYGSGSMEGNAGYSDWRAPTIEELTSTLNHLAGQPSIARKDGNV